MYIELFFRKFVNEEIERKIRNYELIRLMGWVSFKTPFGWGDPEEAIIDSGAPTSVIPFSMWQRLAITRITTYEVSGISPEPECKIPVVIGKVGCILLDEKGNKTRELEIHAYFALIDKLPLILGFQDVLSDFNICFNYKENKAWLEEK